jgi:hypothetical protein
MCYVTSILLVVILDVALVLIVVLVVNMLFMASTLIGKTVAISNRRKSRSFASFSTESHSLFRDCLTLSRFSI